MFDRFFKKPAIKIKTDGGNKSVLLLAQQVAGAAQLQVFKGDLKTRSEITVLFNRLKALLSDCRKPLFTRHDKISVSFDVHASDPAAQLMKLGEPKTVSAVNNERVGIRDIDPRFNDRRA